MGRGEGSFQDSEGNDSPHLIEEAEQELFEACDEYNAAREGLGDESFDEVEIVFE